MAIEKMSLKEQAYHSIREAIISCRYAPSSILSEEMLQNDLGFSRTPIRDALGKLEHEGLLQVMSKKGILVIPLSKADVDGFFEARKLIEPYILRNNGEKIDKANLLELQQRHLALLTTYSAEEETPEFLREIHSLDDELHRAIIAVTSNRYFSELYERLFSQNARFGYLVGKAHPGRTYDTILEHLSIIQLLLQDKLDTAAEKLLLHLENAHRESTHLMENIEIE